MAKTREIHTIDPTLSLTIANAASQSNPESTGSPLRSLAKSELSNDKDGERLHTCFSREIASSLQATTTFSTCTYCIPFHHERLLVEISAAGQGLPLHEDFPPHGQAYPRSPSLASVFIKKSSRHIPPNGLQWKLLPQLMVPGKKI